MKPFVRRLTLLAASVLVTPAHAQVETTGGTTIQFQSPVQYCLPHLMWLKGTGIVASDTILYQLVISANDHNKVGDVFIGLTRKSMPGSLWLYNGGTWSAYDASKAPPAYDSASLYYSGMKLQPVTPLYISTQPTSLTAFGDDGELWVGYGLRTTSAASMADAYQDMLANQRFAKVWDVNTPFKSPVDEVCLTASQARINTVYPAVSGVPNL